MTPPDHPNFFGLFSIDELQQRIRPSAQEQDGEQQDDHGGSDYQPPVFRRKAECLAERDCISESTKPNDEHVSLLERQSSESIAQ